jgi:class 3 adenylate cyclase
LKAAAAAIELSRSVEQLGQAHPLRVRAALHAGPAMVTTFNDRLDYFGSTIHATARLLELSRPGDVMTTSAITSHPDVSRLIARHGWRIEVVPAEAASSIALAGLIVQRCSG